MWFSARGLLCALSTCEFYFWRFVTFIKKIRFNVKYIYYKSRLPIIVLMYWWRKVTITQLVEYLFVVQKVVGSSPISNPVFVFIVKKNHNKHFARIIAARVAACSIVGAKVFADVMLFSGFLGELSRNNFGIKKSSSNQFHLISIFTVNNNLLCDAVVVVLCFCRVVYDLGFL